MTIRVHCFWGYGHEEFAEVEEEAFDLLSSIKIMGQRTKYDQAFAEKFAKLKRPITREEAQGIVDAVGFAEVLTT